MKIYLLLPILIKSFNPNVKLVKVSKIYNHKEIYDYFSDYECYISPEMIERLWNISNKTK